MEVLHKLIIDLQNNARTNTIEVKKGGTNAYTLEMRITSGGHAFDMSDVYTATVKAVKPDESIIYADADIVKDEEGNNINVVRYRLSEAALAVTGKSTYEIELMDSGGITVNSFDFYVNVIPELYNEEDLYDVSDVSGVRSYMARALAAAERSEEVENTFNVLHGSAQEILNMLAGEYDKYEGALEDLQHMVDSGAFDGARGPQGENGADAVIGEGTQVIAFQIVDGELICYYYGDEIPPVSMNDDGELQWSY